MTENLTEPKLAADQLSPKKVEKVSVVTDLRVILEPPRYIAQWYGRDLAHYEKELKNWAQEIYEHVRDHRSLDLVGIDVQRVTEDVCSNCKRPWDVAFDSDRNNEPYCGHCGEVAKV